MSPAELVVLVFAGAAAGLVNAVAGGGTLLTFPTLLSFGVGSVAASVTSTVALAPGYVGGTYAQRRAVRHQRVRARVLVPLGLAGGLTGGLLLMLTDDKLLERIVPFLILSACGLLAIQERIKSALERRRVRPSAHPQPSAPHGLSLAAMIATFAAAVYGGYFGAGLGIVLLAVLGTFLPDELSELNALKQLMSLSAALPAAMLFVVSGRVWWGAAALLATGAVAGGTVGGRLADRLNPTMLRFIVITIGIVVAVVYAAK